MPLPPLVGPVGAVDAEEALRTSRQSRLPQIGELGQRRLAAARVCVLGAGGLGSPALLYLAAAGVGTIGIVDDDVVDASNLQRQLVHGSADVGRPKADSAAEAIRAIAPATSVRRHRERLTAGNAATLLGDYDLVLDGTDNFGTRYLADAACAELGVPLVWAAVLGFDAQVTVFWATPPSGAGVRLTDLFPTAPAEVPSCADAGVLGPLCGQAGAIMAAEAVKLITGAGEPLLGRVLVIDALRATQRELALHPRSGGASANGTGSAATHDTPAARISVAELRELLSRDGERTVVLDVREPSERAVQAIPGTTAFPLAALAAAVAAADPALPPRGTPLVVHCHGEARSEQAARILVQAGYRTVRVLTGGIRAWATEPAPA